MQEKISGQVRDTGIIDDDFIATFQRVETRLAEVWRSGKDNERVVCQQGRSIVDRARQFHVLTLTSIWTYR